MDVLEEYNVPLHKVVALCSDGASTMRGVYRGVCTRLQNQIRESRNQAAKSYTCRNGGWYSGADLGYLPSAEGIFSLHYVCRRLVLTATDAKYVVRSYLMKFHELLTNIFKNSSKSPKRNKKLRNFPSTINERIREDRRVASTKSG